MIYPEYPMVEQKTHFPRSRGFQTSKYSPISHDIPSVSPSHLVTSHLAVGQHCFNSQDIASQGSVAQVSQASWQPLVIAHPMV